MTRRTIARRAAKVGLHLLAGAVCSVGVAWGLEVVRAFAGSSMRPPPWTFFDSPTASLGGAYSRTVGVEYWAVWPMPSGAGSERDAAGPQTTPPFWALPLESTSLGQRTTVGCGLPFICVHFEVVEPGSGPAGFGGAWTVPLAGRDVWLAFRPVWSGLFVNTLCYTALISVPWAFGSLVRRRMRRRRGHCPFCGYDLRGDYSRVCSECGTLGTAE
jgi:hypothetical protein